VVVKLTYCSGKIKFLFDEPQKKTKIIFDDWKKNGSSSLREKKDDERKEKIKKEDSLLKAFPKNEKMWRWSRKKANKSNEPKLPSATSNN